MITHYDDVLSDEERSLQFPIDVENDQEKCTPYMLAVLRENFEAADFMLDNKLASPFFKNKQGDTVFDIVNRLRITNVQQYLVENSYKFEALKK